MLTPFLLFISFWQQFNEHCVSNGGLGGRVTTRYLVNCAYEKWGTGQNCRVKQFSLPLYMTTAITHMSRKLSLSSFNMTLLAYIFTASLFFSKHQQNTFSLLNCLCNCWAVHTCQRVQTVNGRTTTVYFRGPDPLNCLVNTDKTGHVFHIGSVNVKGRVCDSYVNQRHPTTKTI